MTTGQKLTIAATSLAALLLGVMCFGPLLFTLLHFDPPMYLYCTVESGSVVRVTLRSDQADDVQRRIDAGTLDMGECHVSKHFAEPFDLDWSRLDADTTRRMNELRKAR